METNKITDLKDMLKKSGEKYPEKIAYKIRIEQGKYKEITHKQVRNMIDSLGTVLIDMGLKGKRIGVIGENRYEWEIAYLSIVCGTGIVVPLDKSLPENELRSLIERSEIEAIFYTKKYEDSLKKILEEKVGKLKYLISMENEEQELIKKGEQLIKQGNREFIDAKIDNEKMNIMLFTSGTTSASKIVALSHKNLVSNLMDISSILDVNSDDVFLSFLPIHHVFECTVGFLFALYSGAQTVFCDGIRHIMENMNEYKVSVMASVPAIYERIYKIISKNKENAKDLLGGHVKLLISGAASLDPTIEKNYRDLGINLVQGYGLTETSPVIAAENAYKKRSGSIGFPMDNIELEIVDKDENGIGELRVKGPNVMLGYYDNEEETRKVIRDGWFYTGDLGYIDKDGFIFLTGRQKDMIVLKNGKKVFPEELEVLINRLDLVEECIVYGMPDEKDKNDLKLSVKVVYNKDVAKEKYPNATEDELRKVIWEKIKEINKTFPPYKYIKNMILTDEELIKTTTKKVKRQEEIKKILG